MASGKIGTGLVFVVIGVVLLLNNFGKLDWGVWVTLLELWPVFLIAAGLKLATRGTKFVFVSPLVILVAFGYAILSPKHSLGTWDFWSFAEDGTSKSIQYSQPAKDVDLLAIDVDFGAGQLDINGGSTGLYDADLRYRGYRKPKETFTISGQTARTKLSQMNGHGSIGRNDWTVHLTEQKPVDLSVDAGACKSYIDLSDVKLKELSINCGASSVDVELGRPVGLVPVNIDAGASSINMTAPPDAAFRIRVDTAVGSTNLGGSGLNKVGSWWQTPDFDKASDRYEVRISNAVGSFNLDRGNGWESDNDDIQGDDGESV